MNRTSDLRSLHREKSYLPFFHENIMTHLRLDRKLQFVQITSSVCLNRKFGAVAPLTEGQGERINRWFWRYRAEAGKLPGARFARLRRVPRHIEASFMCRWPRRTALGRPPADWETASGGLGNLWKFPACSTLTTNHYFPSFPMLRSSLPNPAGEAEGLVQSWGGERNVVSARRDRTAPNAHCASPAGFLNSAR